MRSRALAALLILARVLGPAGPAAAQQPDENEKAPGSTDERSRGFGGPDQVDNTIANDDETVSRIVETTLWEPWLEWKKGLQEKHGLALAVRVGVHTGPVVIGEVGGGERRETLAPGDTTNLAARLQDEAAPNTVVISAETLSLVRGIFVTQELRRLQKKKKKRKGKKNE